MRSIMQVLQQWVLSFISKHFFNICLECVWLPCGSAGKEFACNEGDLGSVPDLGRSPGEGKGSPFQYSGLENFMACIVHGVAKSRTWLSTFHFQFVCACSVDQLCLTLGGPVDCSPTGSSVRGIFQARPLEWVATSYSRRSSWPRIEPTSLASPAGFFTTAPPGLSIQIEYIRLRF